MVTGSGPFFSMYGLALKSYKFQLLRKFATLCFDSVLNFSTTLVEDWHGQPQKRSQLKLESHLPLLHNSQLVIKNGPKPTQKSDLGLILSPRPTQPKAFGWT